MPVRIEPELRAAIEARAEAEQTTTSEIFREAIRRFLEVTDQMQPRSIARPQTSTTVHTSPLIRSDLVVRPNQSLGTARHLSGR